MALLREMRVPCQKGQGSRCVNLCERKKNPLKETTRVARVGEKEIDKKRAADVYVERNEDAALNHEYGTDGYYLKRVFRGKTSFQPCPPVPAACPTIEKGRGNIPRLRFRPRDR